MPRPGLIALRTRARSLTRVVVASCLIALACPWAGSAAAQPESSVTVRLLGERPWYTPGARLGIRLAVTNHGTDPIDGFLVQIGAHSRVENRSRLHESFSGDAGFLASSYTQSQSDVTVAPGSTTVVDIDDPLSRLGFGSLDFTSEGGVYP